jgi:hypothetical protein
MSRRFALASLLVPVVAGLIGLGAGAASAAKPEIRKYNHGHEYKVKGTAYRLRSSPNMTFHGGPILTSAPAAVQAIFWGTSWSNAGFTGDKQSGLDTFYSGWGGSGYSTTVTEYAGSNGPTSGVVSYAGHVADTSAGPSSAPSTATILAEVSKMVAKPVAQGYYPVYVDLKRGNAGYCAWHDTGTVHGVQVEVAFFFNLDGDAGCDPADSTNNHSQGLAALANVSGHELSEAKTDPQLNAWYDTRGAENADKCAWLFNKVSNFSNGSVWKIQGNWSNAAYNARTGYANGGCIDGN